jgi:hypothetical protein
MLKNVKQTGCYTLMLGTPNPIDLDFEVAGFDLPNLNVMPIFIPFKKETTTGPFFRRLQGIQDRSKVKKETMNDRIGKTLEILNNDTTNKQWIVWCELNDEGRILHKQLPNSELMEGSQSHERKVEIAKNFISGKNKDSNN